MTAPKFTHYTQDEFVAAIGVLAEQLATDSWTPDLLVGVGRGGLTPAVYLSHATGLPMVSIDFSTPIPEFNASLIATLAARTRAGDRLLFIEDINDSGRTIAAIREQMKDAAAAADRTRFAVLMNNVTSVERVDHWARTIDRSVDKDWFVFPWEAVAPKQSLLDDAADVPGRIA